ncbi:sugar phosphate nucleotidyltransferase [Bifidobacterium sp. ESL0728]|uniref:mannose-1-phosphate guanylyltransferase n=1 Tax=Bifidobacterium sp. ESL0728 TaxID=2983220 RepID=UPI0023F83967|nr:sugar phosphate nucleotidyltransferase [Bifidobacterium sp. ESL0728]WEV58736.1 sugar phosphate nucleotidyltransferase [Bifidobacterium sp. ESL0728]
MPDVSTPCKGFEDFYAIIPAGGTGSRLWPLSRGARPKFLYDLMGSGRTLIQSTFDRLARLAGPERIVVSTGWRHVAAVEAQLPELKESNIFAEPVPRDSTAAIALATAILARRHGEHIVVGSFAADHVIRGKDSFADAVRQAVAAARAGYVTTIGIAASRPSTAFGYIHQGRSLGSEIPGAPNARLVERFVEKPDSATAQAYLSTGEYRWNAGMFVMRADVLLDHLREYKPEMYDAISHIADAYMAVDSDNGADTAGNAEIAAARYVGKETLNASSASRQNDNADTAENRNGAGDGSSANGDNNTNNDHVANQGFGFGAGNDNGANNDADSGNQADTNNRTDTDDQADSNNHADTDSQDAADSETDSDNDTIDEAMATYWPGIEKIAFDYAVAEPLSVAGGVAVVPGDFGWDDIGDFNSVAALLPSTGARNIKILGDSDKVVSLDSAGDVVMPLSERTVALLGVNDMVIADTPDALLIAPRARSQEVKDLVAYLDREGRDDIL